MLRMMARVMALEGSAVVAARRRALLDLLALLALRRAGALHHQQAALRHGELAFHLAAVCPEVGPFAVLPLFAAPHGALPVVPLLAAPCTPVVHVRPGGPPGGANLSDDCHRPPPAHLP